MSDIDLTSSARALTLPRLERQLFERRAMKNGFLTALTWAAAILGSIPRGIGIASLYGIL